MSKIKSFEDLLDDVNEYKPNKCEVIEWLPGEEYIRVACSKGVDGLNVYLSKEDIKKIVKWAYED